ncbi:hypothetical protein BGZ90_002975, partial [Linnemannia elongata]
MERINKIVGLFYIHQERRPGVKEQSRSQGATLQNPVTRYRNTTNIKQFDIRAIDNILAFHDADDELAKLGL